MGYCKGNFSESISIKKDKTVKITVTLNMESIERLKDPPILFLTPTVWPGITLVTFVVFNVRSKYFVSPTLSLFNSQN